MNMRLNLRRPWAAIVCVCGRAGAPAGADTTVTKKSHKTLDAVLREPLPPEDLSLAENTGEFVINGPTFSYRVQKISGVINGIHAVQDGQEVIAPSGPADIVIDQYRLASSFNSCQVTAITNGKDKIVIQAKGFLHDPDKVGPNVDFVILHTFFNDGVVVSNVKLVPRADLLVKDAIAYLIPAQGQFNNYIHKRRDEPGDSAVRDRLPESGNAVRLTTLTSCLSVFSPRAALAIFTDGGAIHLSQPNLSTAVAEVNRREGSFTHVSLSQYLVHIAPGDAPFVLKGGEEFSFRVGISVAPNRLPHPRARDLRMFIWIGDEKFPYPTDEEIMNVARWGYTLFQLHRVGTPGEPRPPTGELERVIRKVHEVGMLFLWEENADLLYNRAPGVEAQKAKGKWSLWQGFNYGGHYKATMDPYCDLIATCLGSPNGMADYRLANISRMMDQYPVDGIYLDDNLAYSNCTLWKEHGHPRQVYDCLIELHEMNWRRRELMRSKTPNMVLISHNTKAFILPVIADFDVLFYGEGYCFDSAEDYWENYQAWSRSMNIQGMICPSDDESGHGCSTTVAYIYDLLNGGGQYTQLDWRLFPKKFHYAAGVSDIESLVSKTYNLAQRYFGFFESKPFCFANSADLFTATTRLTYATVYQNQAWGDCLIVIANMNPTPTKTKLHFRSPQTFGIIPATNYLLFDIHHRIAKTFRGDALNEAFTEISIPGQNLQLYCLRPAPASAPFHVWGGKRISELWDDKAQKLTFRVHGPTGLKDTIFIGGAKPGIGQVIVAGRPAHFFYDSTQGVAYGEVTFTSEPLEIEVSCSPDHANKLPEKTLIPDALTRQSASLGK